MKYKFQIENGSIGDGFKYLRIENGIATTDDGSEAMKLLIEAHGGLVEDEPKQKRKTVKKKDVGNAA